MSIDPFRKLAVGAAVLVALAGCTGGDDDGESSASDSFVVEVRAAAAAVEAELGGPQEFFEITATPQLTNVFVAVDDATAVIPYTFVDGELEAPAPRIEGVQGQTFRLEAVDFDAAKVLSGVETDLASSTIDAFSVEGGPGGFVRYVVSVRSEQGGVLDVVVAPSGAVIEVRPL
jgi:hypothetical protein